MLTESIAVFIIKNEQTFPNTFPVYQYIRKFSFWFDSVSFLKKSYSATNLTKGEVR